MTNSKKKAERTMAKQKKTPVDNERDFADQAEIIGRLTLESEGLHYENRALRSQLSKLRRAITLLGEVVVALHTEESKPPSAGAASGMAFTWDADSDKWSGK